METNSDLNQSECYIVLDSQDDHRDLRKETPSVPNVVGTSSDDLSKNVITSGESYMVVKDGTKCMENMSRSSQGREEIFLSAHPDDEYCIPPSQNPLSSPHSLSSAPLNQPTVQQWQSMIPVGLSPEEGDGQQCAPLVAKSNQSEPVSSNQTEPAIAARPVVDDMWGMDDQSQSMLQFAEAAHMITESWDNDSIVLRLSPTQRDDLSQTHSQSHHSELGSSQPPSHQPPISHPSSQSFHPAQAPFLTCHQLSQAALSAGSQPLSVSDSRSGPGTCHRIVAEPYPATTAVTLPDTAVILPNAEVMRMGGVSDVEVVHASHGDTFTKYDARTSSQNPGSNGSSGSLNFRLDDRFGFPSAADAPEGSNSNGSTEDTAAAMFRRVKNSVQSATTATSCLDQSVSLTRSPARLPWELEACSETVTCEKVSGPKRRRKKLVALLKSEPVKVHGRRNRRSSVAQLKLAGEVAAKHRRYLINTESERTSEEGAGGQINMSLADDTEDSTRNAAEHTSFTKLRLSVGHSARAVCQDVVSETDIDTRQQHTKQNANVQIINKEAKKCVRQEHEFVQCGSRRDDYRNSGKCKRKNAKSATINNSQHSATASAQVQSDIHDHAEMNCEAAVIVAEALTVARTNRFENVRKASHLLVGRSESSLKEQAIATVLAGELMLNDVSPIVKDSTPGTTSCVNVGTTLQTAHTVRSTGPHTSLLESASLVNNERFANIRSSAAADTSDALDSVVRIASAAGQRFTGEIKIETRVVTRTTTTLTLKIVDGKVQQLKQDKKEEILEQDVQVLDTGSSPLSETRSFHSLSSGNLADISTSLSKSSGSTPFNTTTGAVPTVTDPTGISSGDNTQFYQYHSSGIDQPTTGNDSQVNASVPAVDISKERVSQCIPSEIVTTTLGSSAQSKRISTLPGAKEILGCLEPFDICFAQSPEMLPIGAGDHIETTPVSHARFAKSLEPFGSLSRRELETLPGSGRAVRSMQIVDPHGCVGSSRVSDMITFVTEQMGDDRAAKLGDLQRLDFARRSTGVFSVDSMEAGTDATVLNNIRQQCKSQMAKMDTVPLINMALPLVSDDVNPVVITAVAGTPKLSSDDEHVFLHPLPPSGFKSRRSSSSNSSSKPTSSGSGKVSSSFPLIRGMTSPPFVTLVAKSPDNNSSDLFSTKSSESENRSPTGSRMLSKSSSNLSMLPDNNSSDLFSPKSSTSPVRNSTTTIVRSPSQASADTTLVGIASEVDGAENMGAGRFFCRNEENMEDGQQLMSTAEVTKAVLESAKSSAIDVAGISSVTMLEDCGDKADGNNNDNKESNSGRRLQTGSEISTKCLAPGASVFAKWSDGLYYPGRLVNHIDVKSNMWLVAFDDGTRCNRSEADFVVCSSLPVGFGALMKRGRYFQPALITAHETKAGEHIDIDVAGYRVKFEDGVENSVTRSDVALMSQHVSVLLNGLEPGGDPNISTANTPFKSACPKDSNVCLDNLIDGKRKRGRQGGGASSLTGESPVIASPSVANECNSPHSLKRKRSSPILSNAAGSALKGKRSRIAEQPPSATTNTDAVDVEDDDPVPDTDDKTPQMSAKKRGRKKKIAGDIYIAVETKSSKSACKMTGTVDKSGLGAGRQKEERTEFSETSSADDFQQVNRVTKEKGGGTTEKKRKLRAGTETSTPKQGPSNTPDVGQGPLLRSPRESTQRQTSLNCGLTRRGRAQLFPDRSLMVNSPIFVGLTFIFTSTTQTGSLSTANTSMQGTTLLESPAAAPRDDETPFDKDDLCRLIQLGGGTVLDKFDTEMVRNAVNRCYLISSTYRRTIKYFCALAAGVRCISHTWILDSVHADKLLDYETYILPAGLGLESQQIIEWRGSPAWMKDLVVYISSTNDDFVQNWREVLEAARCRLAAQLPHYVKSTHLASKKPIDYIDVVIANRQISTDVLNKCKKLSVPIVSCEWVIQSLITGLKPDFNAHPKYSHDSD